MARLPRISPVDVPIHLIQRGNNRQICFASEEDFSAYVGWLKEYSGKYKVDVHSWVMMSNHVHLLCTPRQAGSVSLMMQALGRRYVRYFNFEYQRSGTLWEGRFKSCLVQQDRYLLEVYRYIELNPVRAGMVMDPGEYRWSSYPVNGLGVASDLCTPHPEYLGLGIDPVERRNTYRALFAQEVEEPLLTEIRVNTNKGLAIGNDRFKEEMEKVTGRRVRAKKRGRPLGWRKKEM
ncbi:transposase [Desulfogranum mediterraneum]|uniref:transposase n=1 Tax=Desulfogranum mediterraneum TaxID=160661 RepID=UPI00041B0997|nr:transposase [Desulfogranum mediterraneum]